jgi:hypothetical protein
VLLRCIGLAVFLLLGPTTVRVAGEGAGLKAVARHARFEDFINGTCGKSGANVYVSRKGRVQVINKWDLNKDGYVDVIIPNDHGMTEVADALIYWNTPAGFRSLMPEFPKERPLSQLVFGLLDTDRRHFTRLPAFGGGRAIVADLNRDGYPDIVFCNYIHNYPGVRSAFIYWGSPTGYAPYLRSELQGFGAVSAKVADLNGDGKPDILLVNQNSGGDYKEGVPTNIFWGNPHNYYSTALMTSLPAHSPYGILAADLDDDGYNDILFTGMSDVAYGNARPAPAWLYRGGPDGFTRARRCDIPAYHRSWTVHAADLNRDGYLDLVFAGVDEGEQAGIILWGGAEGYTASRKTVLPLLMKHVAVHQIADLNRDGYLDLIFATCYLGDVKVFWGGKDGYATQNHEVFKIGAGPLTLADLNGDGQLDFIVGGQLDPKTRSITAPTRIYRGRPDGRPEPKPSFELEGYEVGQICVSDLNRDGYLDIVQSNYKTDNTRSLPVFIYWGDKDGRYLNSRRTDLPAESALGLQTIDLNHDGYPDLVVHNHVKDGEHAQRSCIYWNGPQGFDLHRRTELPTFGPHYSQMIDPGNLYTRELEEEYVSAPIALPNGAGNLRLTWKAEEPPGSKLRMQVRSAATTADLSSAKWIGPTGEGTAFERHAAFRLPVPDRAAFLQYRVLFRSVDGGEWPVLTEVEVAREAGDQGRQVEKE